MIVIVLGIRKDTGIGAWHNREGKSIIHMSLDHIASRLIVFR